MKLKQIRLISVLTFIGAAIIAGAVYLIAAREPAAIALDPSVYDDYAGYYLYENGFPVTIRREGDQLITSVPGFASSRLLPETPTEFFIKGSRLRWSFHRDEQGRVDYALSRLNKFVQKAKRVTQLPVNPTGTNGLIAATTGGKAVEAGLQMLKEGGSAADAAMVTALCQVVHAGGSYVSFAGPMMVVYYDAASGKVYYLDAEYATPLEEKDATSIPKRGGRTALVPGFMAGVQALHDRFGKASFKRLFEPAIAMAQQGETVTPIMEWWISYKKKVLSRYPETKKIFTKPDGEFLVKGDLFRQPELAVTLRKVAEQGASYMYEGDWARKFVEVIRREGGKMTLEDLRRYRGIWEEPLQTSYRDYVVYATGPTPWGGVNIIQAMNLLELADLRQYGPYTKSAESLYWLMQISACQNSTRLLPKEARISKQAARELWAKMQGQIRPVPGEQRTASRNSPHTDGLVVVDRWGNMAAVNHTINSMLWGETGLFVDGVSIPDSASFQPDDIAKAGPGNRVPNGMSPLIVCRNGKPVLGSAATGGGLHAKTLQVLANILEFGMDPQAAVDAPAFVGWGAGDVEPGTFEPELLERLKKLGLRVQVISPEKSGSWRGYWAGAQVDPETGVMRGGATRGMDSGVAAY